MNTQQEIETTEFDALIGQSSVEVIGKSIEGWYAVINQEDDTIINFMDLEYNLYRPKNYEGPADFDEDRQVYITGKKTLACNKTIIEEIAEAIDEDIKTLRIEGKVQREFDGLRMSTRATNTYLCCLIEWEGSQIEFHISKARRALYVPETCDTPLLDFYHLLQEKITLFL